MKFGIFTYGSRGDVQPFVALARELIRQNVAVILYAPENFKDFVENYGVPFKPLTGNADELLNSPEARKVLKAGNTVSLLRLIQREGKKIQQEVNKDLLKGCQEVDFIISSVLCQVWISCITEKLNKKWGLITFSPPTTATKEFPFAGLSMMNNKIYNPISHKLFEYLYWIVNKKSINAFRKSLSIPPQNKNILNRITENNILNLYAISPSLIKRPSDWPGNSDITGYLTLVPLKKIKPDRELSDWVSAGVRPIYLSFGSMPIPDPELLVSILTELLKTTEMRFIFCKGWSRVAGLPDHTNLFVIDHADHEWLLPQCEMAVIHGGAGTIGASLKAGIPLIVASVFGDQPWWGKMLEEKKLGIHLPFKKLKTSSLLHAIKTIQASAIPKNVAELGSKINNEDGVGSAVTAIKNYFHIAPPI